MIDFQVTRTQGNGFGSALRDEAGLESGESRQRNGGAVVGVEAFGFDQAGAVKTESGLRSISGRPVRAEFGRPTRRLFEDALICAGWRGKTPPAPRKPNTPSKTSFWSARLVSERRI